MNLFGRKKAGPPQVTSSGGGGGGGGGNTTDAIGKLRDATETLEKREEHLQRKIDNEVKQARDFSKANKKQQALTCIKRKKMYEKQLEQIMGAKTTLETQRLALESMNINREALQAQQLGARAMEAEVRRMGGVDAVENTMDQVEDGLQDADEIGQAMGRAIGAADADDDELLAELEELEQDGLDADLLDVAALAPEPAVAMPSAPFSAPSAPKTAVQMTDEERELAELEASMAM
jgi:charged multivesicular body protein 4